jgi:hypothetical protein
MANYLCLVYWASPLAFLDVPSAIRYVRMATVSEL